MYIIDVLNYNDHNAYNLTLIGHVNRFGLTWILKVVIKSPREADMRQVG